jgi:hypothetical protein
LTSVTGVFWTQRILNLILAPVVGRATATHELGANMRPQLIVHTTYFPLAHDSEGIEEQDGDPQRANAVELGTQLYNLVCRPLKKPLQHGAGVQVRVATRFDLIDVEEAERVMVIPVLGGSAYQNETIRQRVIATVKSWVATQPKYAVIVVPCSLAWRAADSEFGTKQLLTDLYAPHNTRQTTLDEIVLAIARVLSPDDAHITQLFISHAKADVVATGNAAKLLHDHVTQNSTGKAFFDSVTLLSGDGLAEQIEADAGRGVFVMIRGDAYSSRAWCQRELLIAKRHRIPSIAVEVLTHGEPRSLSFGGNCPTFVWDDTNQTAAGDIARRAMVEGVRAALFLLEGRRVCELAELPEDTVVMSRPPELLDVESLRRAGPTLVLHPEPELSLFERQVLHGSYPRLRLATPTSAYSNLLDRSFQAPLAGMQVALSLSDSPDVGGINGTTAEHVEDATVALARTLASAGAGIAYGGDFRTNGFTPLLIELLQAYNQTSSTPAQLLHAYLGVPLDPGDAQDLAFTAHHLGRFGDLAKEVLLDTWSKTDVEAWPAPAKAALYFSDMRRLMALQTQALVVIGGQAVPKNSNPARSGYGGRYPGGVEEAWRALEAGCPLYVVGGFGGAAELVSALLLGRDTPERLCEETWQHEPWFEELTAGLDAESDSIEALGLPATMYALADCVRQAGAQHLQDDESSCAWNGLTVEQNKTLFQTRDPMIIASLVMRGLLSTREVERSKRIDIELTRGSIHEARGLEVVVVPAFDDVDLGGAGATIDRITGRSATRARDKGTPLALITADIDAQYVFVANLGDMSDATENPGAAVRMAAESVVSASARYGFSKLGLVTFLGNVAADLGQVVEPMLDGLYGARSDAEWLWFEADPTRFNKLESLLRADDRVSLTVRKPKLQTTVLPAVDEADLLYITRIDEALHVTLLLRRGNGLAPTHSRPFSNDDRDRLRGGVTARAPAAAELQALGEQIGHLLLGSTASTTIERFGGRPLLLSHDMAGSAVPYESMCVINQAGEEVRPALNGGIVRRLRVEGALEHAFLRPPDANALRVLVVVDPKGDLDAANREGDTVVERLKAIGIECTVLRGNAATRDAVLESLGDELHDVLHYCGHAFFWDEGDNNSGLVCSDGHLTLKDVRALTYVPRVAFVNACQSGRFRSAQRSDLNAEAFAEFFLMAGVDAYLGTFWTVSDTGAAVFAEVVYGELAKGCELGKAVLAGRRALFESGSSDWANYLLYGHEKFRLVIG